MTGAHVRRRETVGPDGEKQELLRLFREWRVLAEGDKGCKRDDGEAETERRLLTLGMRTTIAARDGAEQLGQNLI